MNKQVKLSQLRLRERNILARGKYKKSGGVLKKVQRQIATLEKEL